mgnify:CR=1 FL=1
MPSEALQQTLRYTNKPLHKQDFMYMRHLDQIINQLKSNKNAELGL